MAERCLSCGQQLSAAARFCPNCGRPAAGSAEDEERHARLAGSAPTSLVDKIRSAELSGERRTVTAIFADVVGSTPLMERLDPEDWTAMVNIAFDIMSRAVYRYEGTIAQLQGDAMVAFFGAPVAHEDDPERAVRAALDMIADIEEYREQLRTAQGIDFQIRAGINTGPVLVGKVGTDLRYEYTALGDAMNVAARVEGAAPPGSVLITSDTYRSVSGTFDVADLGSVPLKGKSEPVRVYRVAGLKAAPGPKRGIAGLASPMVGRQGDLDALREALAIVLAGRGRVACVVGEPGLGKTRLVSEFRARSLEEAGAVRWIEGQCLSFGRSFPYHLIVDLVRSAIGVPPSAGPGETRAGLERSLAGLPEEDRREGRQFLANLLSLRLEPADAERVAALDPDNLQIRYVGALNMLLAALAAAGPVVLLCEDVHWADTASAEVLGQLIGLASRLRILTLLTSRPDPDAPGWQLVTRARDMFGHALTEIQLAPLTDGESRRLVANLLAIESLPAPARETILARAEGNPFFVEELVRVLIDRGAIAKRGDRWVATSAIEGVEIPDTLQALLLARVDRLPEEARHSLRVASVIGRRFSARVLEHVLALEARA